MKSTIGPVFWANALIRAALVVAVVVAGSQRCLSTGLVITPTFTSNFNANFGANAVAAQNAWIAAANVFSSNFSDNIHVNINVDAVAGTSVFGQSNTSLDSTSYANLRGLVVLDATTADDATALGAGGSMTIGDPTGGAGTWWVSRAQAKAIGLIADDLSNDGKTTFGAGNPFSFSGTPGPGTYSFQGIAAHEISEVMGRLGLSGGTIGSFPKSYSLIDNFSYTAAATKGLGNGAGNNFSIDNGTTLLKLWNNAAANGFDSRDWAPGTNDAFNQFSSSGVANPVSTVDLRLMDVIGYNRIAVPEPSTAALAGFSLLGLVGYARRRRGTLRP
jgi:PEP-CTERM motif